MIGRQAFLNGHGLMKCRFVVNGLEFSSHAHECITDSRERRTGFSDRLLASPFQARNRKTEPRELILLQDTGAQVGHSLA